MRHCISLLLLVFLLAACGQDNHNDEPATTNPIPKEEELETDNQEDEPEETKKEEEVPAVVEKTPVYRLNEANWTIDRTDGGTEKGVLLTIDDAPDKNAVEMAQILDKLGVKAIFFVNGHFLDSEEEAKNLKAIYDLGFPIGNHTQTHQNLKDLTEEEQRTEILSVNKRVEEITGEKPRFFRAPFGSNTDFSKQLAKEEGMLVMNWTYGYDWEKDYQNPDSLADIMVNTPYLTNGANLLMHDRTWTKDALEGIVKGLQEKGYQMIDPDLIETPASAAR